MLRPQKGVGAILLIRQRQDHGTAIGFVVFFNALRIRAAVNMEPTGNRHGVDLSSLRQSGDYSDLRLVCEDREFAVHKNILCTQSRVLRAECEGGFQVRFVIPSVRNVR